MKRPQFLPLAGLRLLPEGQHGLRLEMPGLTTALGPPQRALPLSDPDHYIVLHDTTGHEIGIIQDPEDLEPASRELLLDNLARHYDIRVISRIIEVERDPISGQVRWRVELIPDTPDELEPDAADDVEPIRGPLRSLLRRVTEAREGVPADISEFREFIINGPEDVQTARYPRIFVTDLDGTRYEIPDCEALSLDSRLAGERYF